MECARAQTRISIGNALLHVRVARLKYEKIAKFDVKNSQNSHLKLKNSHKLATFY
jgi:hypothetical protein